MQTAAGNGSESRPERMLTLRSGGIYLLIAAAMCALIVGLWLNRLSHRPVPVGDGVHLESFGYNLATCLVPREQLVPAGFPQDGIPAMTDPPILTLAGLEQLGERMRSGHQGKYLVPSDRVIGVQVGGQSRAYPLKVLNWHEIVNDTLGDVPVAVTYHPLCDSAVVFDRRVDGEMLTFGVSGLLYNSNLVMYDRQAERAAESLWSQLQFRALAGPAAERGAELELMPAIVTHWSDWLAAQPETTVLGMDLSRMKVYKRSYDSYLASDEIRYPVTPMPPDDRHAFKEPILAVRIADTWRVWSLAEIAAAADATGRWGTEAKGQEIEFVCQTKPLVAWARNPGGEPLLVVQSLWFAWGALHPQP